ncbi:MAG: NAD(P)/FAD-dependent oxidoreductase [Clostridia bacterium]
MKFNDICKNIHAISKDINIYEKNNCIVLEGELDSWDKVVEAGKRAVNKKKYLGVINNIKLKGFTQKVLEPSINDTSLDGSSWDVVIVGAGVIGCATARELSKYKLKILLIDKCYDVALGASSRNDGAVHVGIDLMPKQQKAHYNAIANKMYGDFCEELEVPFERKGHIMMFSKRYEKIFVPIMKIRAKQLGVPSVKYISTKNLKKIEPSTPDFIFGGAIMKSGGIVCPYKLTIALAESAVINGVTLSLETIVKNMIVKNGEITQVVTNRGVINAKTVVNCAGVYSDVVAEMAGDRTFTIHPRKGTNVIVDKKKGYYTLRSIAKAPFAPIIEKIFEKKVKSDKLEPDALPSQTHTKGGGFMRTVDGNVLVGPNAKEVPDREDCTTDLASINEVVDKQHKLLKEFGKGDIITYFSGVRAPTYEEDFVVRKGIFCKNIIEAGGIQSPGITAAPAIAMDLAKFTVEVLGGAQKNDKFVAKRKAIPEVNKMNDEQRNALIKTNPNYGVIICRCEEISKGEILDAINSPVPALTVDAIKRRCRPGMGRCQGGFCGPLVNKILAETLNVEIEDITKANAQSVITFGNTKCGGNQNERI